MSGIYVNLNLLLYAVRLHIGNKELFQAEAIAIFLVKGNFSISQKQSFKNS